MYMLQNLIAFLAISNLLKQSYTLHSVGTNILMVEITAAGGNVYCVKSLSTDRCVGGFSDDSHAQVTCLLV